MASTLSYKLADRKGLFHLLVGILVFGSLWGFLEATLGGFLHVIIFPNKGAIMSGIGLAIMASALAIYKKPSMLPGIGIVAASFKLLDVWIFSLAINSVHIINPAMAIIFESLAFGAVAVFLINRIAKNVLTGVAAGAITGIITATAYVYFAVYITNSPLFARIGVSSVAEFIADQGVVQAAFWAILLPLGYLAGKKLATKPFPVLAKRRILYYAASTTFILFCWGVSIIAIMAGL